MTDQELHARHAHPDWEYATTEGPRKQWDDIDVPPRGSNGEPDHSWERNTDAGRDGWDRFDYTEESYWRRPKPKTADSGNQYARDIEAAIGLNSGGTGTAMVHAVRDAILNVRDQQLLDWRRKAIHRGLAAGHLQGVIEGIRELADEEVASRGTWGDGYRAAQADLREILDTLQPKEQP